MKSVKKLVFIFSDELKIISQLLRYSFSESKGQSYLKGEMYAFDWQLLSETTYSNIVNNVDFTIVPCSLYQVKNEH